MPLHARGTMPDKHETIIMPGQRSVGYWQDVWSHRELIAFLAWRDLLVRYKQTVAGITWNLLKPLATLIVYTIVFGKIADLPSGGIPYILIVLTGLLPWQLFTLVVTLTGEAIIANASLVGKVYFPRIIIPLSSIAVVIVDHFVTLLLVVGMLMWLHIMPGWQILLLPLVTILGVVTAFGLGLIIAVLNTRYRDIRQLLPLIIQLGVFVAPVGYATGILPAAWRLIYSLNPAVGIIDAFRWCILGRAR